jgi:hypothetical protein
MSHFQSTNHGSWPSGAIDELEPIPGLKYTEIIPDFQDQTPSSGRGTVTSNELADADPGAIAPPRHGRPRSHIPLGDRSRSWSRSTSLAERSPSPTPGVMAQGHILLSGGVLTHRAGSPDAFRTQPTFTTSRPIDIPGAMADSSRRSTYQDDSDSELYADSDGDFEDVTSSLSLEIRPDMRDLEKWELPSRRQAFRCGGICGYL